MSKKTNALRETKGTILLLGVDELSAGLLKFVLCREGYQVLNAQPADITSVVAVRPDLVFIGNAYTSGDQQAMLVNHQGLQPNLPIPVIAVARRFAVKQDIDTARSAGVHEYIVLPFHHAELLAQVERNIGRMQ